MAGGLYLAVDRASGRGILVGEGVSELDVVDVRASVAALGGPVRVTVRHADGELGLMTPHPNLLGYRRDGGPWRYADGVGGVRQSYDPPFPGRWIMVSDSGSLCVVDRAAATITEITAPGMPARRWHQNDKLPAGAVTIPILQEGGGRCVGHRIIVRIPDLDPEPDWRADDLGDDVELESELGPDQRRALAAWCRSGSTPTVYQIGRQVDDAVYLPDEPSQDYTDWGGWGSPHDSPEWADIGSLPGWVPPGRGTDDAGS